MKASRIYKLLTWEPKGTKHMTWESKMFHRLWMWASIILLVLSAPHWLHQPTVFGGNIDEGPDTAEQLNTQNQWVDNYDGTCTVRATGELFNC